MIPITVKFLEFERTMRLSMLDLTEDWDNCELCDNLAENRSQVVHGSGHPNADLMIIGEGPGNDEDDEGVPFIGESGGVLNNLLAVNNMTREDVFVENIVACRPLDWVNGRKTLRPPSKIEVANCLPRLHETIRQVDPLLILVLGRSALHTLTGDSSLTIKKTRGEVHVIRVPGIFKMIDYPIVVSQHPAFILRNPSTAKHSPKWHLVQDFGFASNLLELARKCYGRSNGQNKSKKKS
jgi:DNA polymerase